MKIEIYKDTKVFVVAPANTFTGGPELLHQLAFHLRRELGIESFMYYVGYNPSISDTPVHPELAHYKLPYVLQIPNSEDTYTNILITPEVLQCLRVVKNYKQIRRGIWFLGVYPYYFSKTTRKDFLIQRIINKISTRILKKHRIFELDSEKNFKKLTQKFDYRKDELLQLANFYLAQSHFAMQWFAELKPMFYLSDYLNESFLKIVPELSKKENIVAYYPSKGFGFTRKIIKKTKDIKFVPITNMTRQQVIETLAKAKVYIDFGSHSGKDRIPREAAILGCCVITGKRGAAAFPEDVPIPEDYKFDDKVENIPKIIQKIRDCIENFEERYKDFEFYRQIIRNEPQKFIEDIRNIFTKL